MPISPQHGPGSTCSTATGFAGKSQTIRPRAVYHCAGASHVGASWNDTAQPLANNALATHYLLDALRRAGGEVTVLVTGSATVYAPSTAPLREDDLLAPNSPYAISKLAQEQLALRESGEDGVSVIVARPFNHTGPRQRPDFAAPGMARQIALIERGALEPLIKVGNLDAERDLTDVRDTVRGYALLMEKGVPGMVYNVASGVARSIRAVLDALLQRSRVPIAVAVDPNVCARSTLLSSLATPHGFIRRRDGRRLSRSSERWTISSRTGDAA